MTGAGAILRNLLTATWVGRAAPALLLLAGCDESEKASTAQKIVCDLTAHKFVAERRYHSYPADAQGEQVDYLERVRSAGNGKDVVIELLELDGKRRDQMVDPTEIAWFDNLAVRLQAGDGVRAIFQRDPRIDDLDRILLNYYVTPVQLGRESIRKGGEPSVTFKLEPRVQDRPFYVLTVSTARGREGFPLICSEYGYGTTGPRLVSEMRVTSLRYGDSDGEVVPPASPVVRRSDLGTLDVAADVARRNGVRLLLPPDAALPYGFALTKVEEVTFTTTANPTRVPKDLPLYRFVYSDGIERIDFIAHVATGAAPPGFLGHGPMDVVTVRSFGAISVATLLHEGTQIVIESRVAADRFDAMLKALAPVH